MPCVAKNVPRGFAVVLLTISLGACQTVKEHASQVNEAQALDEKISVGTVQRSIKVGMSSADVIEVLGAPNIVSTDDESREVWVYDKVSTTRVFSSSNSGVNILILGGGARSGAESNSQRTLTIVIKYDKSAKVRDFSYRSSSF
jgi:outer membrane protein assembly factor BamE (lipoprotein component of BamABCDE complex)